MPEATQYIMDQSSNAGKQLEEAFTEEHNQRQNEIEKRWNYYHGKHKKPLKLQKDGYDDNISVNHTGALTDRIVGFVIGEGITFDAGENEQADQDVNELWQMNRGEILKESLVLSGAIEGHDCIRLTPQAGEPYPKLNRIKQVHFASFWNPFDTADVKWYRLQHLAGGMGKRIDYVRGALVDDEIDHEQDGWTELVFEALDGTENIPGQRPRWKLVNSQPWPYDWPPLVDWQNLPNPNGYYGKSDIEEAMALNDSLNFILSNAQRIIKHHADPKTVGTGFTAQELVQTAVGGLYTVASPEAKIYNLEMQSDGAMVQWLTNIITAGLWQSGGMVDNSTVKDLVGQITNFGLRVLFANAIKRTQKKRLLYDEAFEAIGQRAMELAGRAVPETIITIWPDVLPEDEATINTLIQELQLQIISKQTYRNLRGYDHEGEEDRLIEEGQQGGNVGTNILDLITGNRAFNRGV